MYFKALQNDVIVDVYETLQYVKYDEKAKMILRCRKEEAYGLIQRNGEKIYQVDGWPSLPGEYESVTLVEFEDSEMYYGLLAALNENQTVEEPEEEIADTQDIEMVREYKINAMSKACESTIINGFDIVLNDGENHHFSLEITDQITISILATKALAGETNLPWHADGEPCQFYSTDDILSINNAMETLVTFNQTYFNSLKMYILSIEDVKTINNIYYGIIIPEAYQSDVFKALMSA